jgi:hypothetical protein
LGTAFELALTFVFALVFGFRLSPEINRQVLKV